MKSDFTVKPGVGVSMMEQRLCIPCIAGMRCCSSSAECFIRQILSLSVYAATKGAVEQLTRQLAKEFGPKDIVINCIVPGQVATDLFLNGKSPELVDSFRRMNAFGRLGEPEDIANALELLVSDKARWKTGQKIRVNGGLN